MLCIFSSIFSFFFFFSSRRRHTRFDCDWSSDVCSSDLFGEKSGDVRDASLTTPPGIEGTVVDVKIFCRSEEHTSELQSQSNLVCRLLLEKKKNKNISKQHNKDTYEQIVSPTATSIQ